MKRIKNLIIMAGVLALLVVVLLVYSSVNKAGNGGDTTAAAAESFPVAAVEASKISSVNIVVTTDKSNDGAETSDESSDETSEQTDAVTTGEASGGETVVRSLSFTLNDKADAWLWSVNSTVPLDNAKFAAMVTALNEAASPYRLTGVQESALGEYGLSTPYVDVTFGNSDGTSARYLIGKVNTFNGMYYFADASDTSVIYMVDKAVPEALDITVYDLVLYDELPAFTATGLTSLTYTHGSDKLVYTYYPTGNPADYTDGYSWYLSVNGATGYPVSGTMADSLSNAVVYMSYSECVSYDTALEAEFGLDAPGKLVIDYKVTETVTDSTSGTSTEITKPAQFTLYFGGNDGDGHYYVRPDGSTLVYTLSYSDVYESLFAADETELRPAELFLPNYDFIDDITVTAGGNSLKVVLNHSGDSVTYSDASGATLNYEKFQAILSALTEMKATSYTSVLEPDASAGSDTLFTAAMTFNSGASAAGELVIKRYSAAYCSVSFMGRADQLITLEDAQSLAALVDAYFAS